MIDKVTGNRMACDNNPFLVAMWEELINNKCSVPKTHIDKEYYSRIREKYNENKSGKGLSPCEKAEIGWVGFMGSFNENSLGVIRDTMSVRGIIYLSK